MLRPHHGDSTTQAKTVKLKLMLNPALSTATPTATPLVAASRTAALTPAERVWSLFVHGARNLAPNLQVVGQPRHVGRTMTLCVDVCADRVPAATAQQQLQGLAEYIQFRVGAPFVRVSQREDGLALIEMPAPVPRLIHLDDNKATLSGARVLMGPLISDYGDAELNLDDTRTPHVLMVTSHTERVMLFRALMYQLARQNRPGQLRFIPLDDAHVLSDSVLQNALMLCKPPASALEARQLLEWVLSEVARREASSTQSPKFVLLLTEAERWLKQPPFVLMELMARGGRVGVHIIAATTQVSAEVLDGELAAKFPARMVGQMNSEAESELAAGAPAMDCHWQLGDGDTLLLPAGQRFQCPVVSEAAFQALPRAGRLVEAWALPTGP